MNRTNEAKRLKTQESVQDLHCKAIAERLKAYNEGRYVEYNGVDYDTNELETVIIDGYEYYRIDGENVDPKETEPASLYDFFKDYIDINWILDSNKKLQAVRVMVAYGGPTIYVNTENKQVELFWWNENGTFPIDDDLCAEINRVFEEYWYMLGGV